MSIANKRSKLGEKMLVSFVRPHQLVSNILDWTRPQRSDLEEVKEVAVYYQFGRSSSGSSLTG